MFSSSVNCVLMFPVNDPLCQSTTNSGTLMGPMGLVKVSSQYIPDDIAMIDFDLFAHECIVVMNLFGAMGHVGRLDQ